jgi:glycosyltransferase involved in cell wall biosynthesis
MTILWICGLPQEVQREVLRGQDYGANQAWSWIMGHLPPPEGIELHIACRTAHHTSPQEFAYRGARFHLIPVKARARIFCLYQFDWLFFRDLAARLKPAVVHGWGTEDAFAQVALKLAPERHLIQIQGNINVLRKRGPMPWLSPLSAWSERRVLARARHVVAENEFSLAAARPMISTKSVHVVEHPIRHDFRTAVPADGESRQILFVGMLEDRKGIWDALEAFRNGAPSDWKLVIVGNGKAGAVARLHRLISENGLESRVQHHRQLGASEIVSLMRASSVFLLPTWIDTGPTALKEAMAMGLWPVCYDNSGPAHYIRYFQYGSLAEDLKVSDLTAVLKQALAAQPWKQPANRAKIDTHIRPHFDRERIWRELAALYRNISTQ